MADLFVTAIDVFDCGQNNKKYTQHMVLEHLNIHIQKKRNIVFTKINSK